MDGMAETASTQAVRRSLEVLAGRFRALARLRAGGTEAVVWPDVISGRPRCSRPGDPAPRAGRYRQLNVFGSPTGEVVEAAQGDRLPLAPRSFTWELVQATEEWQ